MTNCVRIEDRRPQYQRIGGKTVKTREEGTGRCCMQQVLRWMSYWRIEVPDGQTLSPSKRRGRSCAASVKNGWPLGQSRERVQSTFF